MEAPGSPSMLFWLYSQQEETITQFEAKTNVVWLMTFQRSPGLPCGAKEEGGDQLGAILIVQVGVYDGLERDGESGQIKDEFWRLSQ